MQPKMKAFSQSMLTTSRESELNQQASWQCCADDVPSTKVKFYFIILWLINLITSSSSVPVNKIARDSDSEGCDS